MARLKDKVAIITGAASGIGEASANRFAKEGASVVIADINGEGAQQVAAQISATGGQAIGLKVDIGVESELKSMIDQAISTFGRLDILFNNALDSVTGYVPSEKDFLNFDGAISERLIRTNVLGGVLATKHALPHFISQGAGSVLFTSSIASLDGDVQQFSYGAAKAMTNWYVKTIATTFGPRGIRCNGILPGVTMTPAMKNWATPEMLAAFVDLQCTPRLGQPEDVANLALFLASDEASYINGGLYVIDGGMSVPAPLVALQRQFMEMA